MVSKINCAPVGKILNQGAGVPRLCCSISAPFWVEIQESSLTSLSETNVTELINNNGNLQSTYNPEEMTKTVCGCVCCNL